MGAALLMTGLVGCGRGPTTGTSRTVASTHGPVTVPVRAERVVCLDLSKIQRMLDVGCVPVGVPTQWEPLAGHADWYAGVPKIGTQAAYDIEAIAALRPDLLLGGPQGVDDTRYSRLSALAPTVLLAAPGAGGKWKELSAADAVAAGRDAELATSVAGYERRVQQVRAAHADLLATLRWGVAFGVPGAAFAFLPDAGMGEVLTDLGARFGTVAAGRSGIYQQLSYEELSRFADCDIVLVDGRSDGTPSATAAPMLAQRTFAALPAAVAGQVHPLSHLLVFSYGEALGLLDQIDALLTRRRAAPPR